MKMSPDFHVPQELPPKTALALFDLLNGLADAIWQQYQPELIECIYEERRLFPPSQRELKFDDDIEF